MCYNFLKNELQKHDEYLHFIFNSIYLFRQHQKHFYHKAHDKYIFLNQS